MSVSELLSISEFAAYSRTTRDALLFYDKIGLFSPVLRGKNNDRRYKVTQVGHINAIRILQKSGMSLTDIKEIIDNRSPEAIGELLVSRIDEIDRRIDSFMQAKKLMLAAKDIIRSATGIDETAITTAFMPAEAIVLGHINDYSNGRTDYDALVDFYNKISESYPNLDLNYPVWGLFSQQRVRARDYAWPDRYYFYNPYGHDKKPASLYVIGYTRGGYGPSDELFEQLLEFVDSNNYKICGDIYKEYPLNEICTCDEQSYLIRIMIPVCEPAD